MPVKFHCPQCHQLLSVGSRKVGSQVDCPKCREPVTVPTPEEAKAERVASRTAAAVQVDVAAGYPGEIEPPPLPGEAPAVELPFSFIDTAPSRDPLARPRRRESPSNDTSEPLLLVSRRTLYLQGALFALVAGVAFATGFLMGYGISPEDHVELAEGAAVVQGTIEFRDAGTTRADSGALVLLVPDGKLPSPKLAVTSLRPGESGEPLPPEVLLALEDLGGNAQRTNASGSYALQVPGPGKYFLCIVSRHAQRAANSPAVEFQLAIMDRYFVSAAELIGQQQYVWQPVTIDRSPFVKPHTF